MGYNRTIKQTERQTEITTLYTYIYIEVEISVCLYVCPIIIHKTDDRFASNFEGIRQNPENVPNSKILG